MVFHVVDDDGGRIYIGGGKEKKIGIEIEKRGWCKEGKCVSKLDRRDRNWSGKWERMSIEIKEENERVETKENRDIYVVWGN